MNIQLMSAFTLELSSSPESKVTHPKSQQYLNSDMQEVIKLVHFYQNLSSSKVQSFTPNHTYNEKIIS